ncbi:MAG: InlB B-repeat-containing protein, partial [Mogibacterium sp.]|nr:InlB B-repeat-containing protein [Mogibacterium sp.]
MENKKLRKAIALVVAGTLVVTSMTYIGSNNLKAADEDAANQVEQVVDEATEMEAETAVTENPSTSSEKIDISSDDSDAEPASDTGSTSEKTDVEETDSDEETKMPAQSFDQTANNGIRVVVSAPEGAFPEGTAMKVTAISRAKAISLLEDDVENVKDANGVDITFYFNGKEIQPEKKISVKLSNAKVKGKEFNIYHVEDNGDVEKVGAEVDGNNASFKADTFSIYIVEGETPEPEEDNTLNVTINFFNSDGAKLGSDNTILDGESITEEGYYEGTYTIEKEFEGTPSLREQSDMFVLEGNVLKIKVENEGTEVQEETVNIVYIVNAVEFTINYQFEKLGEGGGYEENPELISQFNLPTTGRGKAGTSAVVNPGEVTGFVAQDVPDTIIEEEGTVVDVKYDRNVYNIVYNTNGGSYIPPKEVKHGDNAVVYTSEGGELICSKEEHRHTAMPTSDAKNNKDKTIGCYTSRKHGLIFTYYSWDLSCGKDEHSHTAACYTAAKTNPMPTKLGYVFEGWYSDKACTTPISAIVSDVQGNVNAYAKWTAGAVGYSIVYQKQNLDGSYSYVSTSTKQGTVGETVTGNGTTVTFENSKYYHIASTTSAPVKADGSTVVYVKYDLNTYYLQFDLNTNNKKVKMTIGGRTYTKDSSKYTITCHLGEDISSQWPTADNFNNELTFCAWNNSFVSKRFEVTTDMLQDVTDKTTTTYKASYESGSKVILHYMLQNADNDNYTDEDKYRQVAYANGTFTAKSIFGFENVKSESKKENDVLNYYFFYKRASYNIDYYYGSNKLDTKSGIRFGKNINNNTYNFVPTTKPAGVDNEATFGGWYDNADCTGNAYTFTTMPASNLKLYAKWVMPDRTLTLSYGNGQEATTITYPKGTRPDEVADPTREGYIFTGWYTATEGGILYDVTQPLMNNTTVYAHWKPVVNVSYRVEFVTDKGTQVHQPVTRNGKIDSTVSEYAQPAGEGFANYYPDATKKDLKLTSNVDTNVITFVYSECNDFRYKVKYAWGNGESEYVWGNNGRFYDAGNQSTVRVKAVAGDIPDGYEIDKDRNKSYQIADLGTDEGQNVVTFWIKAKEYTITYNLDGGSWAGEEGTSHPAKYTAKQLAAEPITVDGAKKSNASFVGWDFTAVDGKIQVNAHDPRNPVIENGSYGNLVFTARWAVLSAQNKPYTYDGTAHGIDAATITGVSAQELAKYGYTIKYSFEKDGAYSEIIPTKTDAGEYKVYVIAESSHNYRTLKAEAILKINKADVQLTSASLSKQYDGTALV